MTQVYYHSTFIMFWQWALHLIVALNPESNNNAISLNRVTEEEFSYKKNSLIILTLISYIVILKSLAISEFQTLLIMSLEILLKLIGSNSITAIWANIKSNIITAYYNRTTVRVWKLFSKKNIIFITNDTNLYLQLTIHVIRIELRVMPQQPKMLFKNKMELKVIPNMQGILMVSVSPNSIKEYTHADNASTPNI